MQATIFIVNESVCKQLNANKTSLAREEGIILYESLHGSTVVSVRAVVLRISYIVFRASYRYHTTRHGIFRLCNNDIYNSRKVSAYPQCSFNYFITS